MQIAQNEIVNSALPSEIASKTTGEGLAFYIATLWRTSVIVGGLAFLLYLVWGGIEWMTSGGEKTKLEEAQKKITNSAIGLAVLVGSYAIIYFIQGVFKLNLLKPVFENNLIP